MMQGIVNSSATTTTTTTTSATAMDGVRSHIQKQQQAIQPSTAKTMAIKHDDTAAAAAMENDKHRSITSNDYRHSNNNINNSTGLLHHPSLPTVTSDSTSELPRHFPTTHMPHLLLLLLQLLKLS